MKNDLNEHLDISSGYVLIENVEVNFHRYQQSHIFRKLLYQYLRRIRKKSDAIEKYSVRIFIASGDSIDNKIDKINRRLIRKRIIR